MQASASTRTASLSLISSDRSAAQLEQQQELPLGIVQGMSNEAYHALTESLSSSGLRKLARSPLHFFGSTLDPQRPPAKGSDAMAAGTLAHCALLEPDQLEQRYVVVPPFAPKEPTSAQRNAKKPSPETLLAIEWWDEFGLANAGKEIISAEQLLVAQRQAAAMRALPEVGPLLMNGKAEVSAFWRDAQTGVHCRCRPDWVTDPFEHIDADGVVHQGVVLLDPKTTQDASPSGFARAIWNYRYDLQAAWYSDGYEQASGLMVLGFVFVAVESEWPHAAAAYMLDNEAMKQAREQIRALLDLYVRCKETGEWPGYSSGVRPISLPRWARPSTATPAGPFAGSHEEEQMSDDAKNAALTEYDFIIVIDTSGSMAEPVKAGSSTSRWEAVQESAITLIRDVEKLDADGLGLVLFGGEVKSFDQVGVAKARDVFGSVNPRGGTPLAEALTEALKLAGKSEKKDFIVVFTDGVPNDRAAAAAVITSAANAAEKDEDLTILFVQVGDDAKASAYLKSLDDDLKGAKFDIVDAKTVEEADKFASTAELILAAIAD